MLNVLTQLILFMPHIRNRMVQFVLLLDVNECENASKVCANNTDCENTVGSFKCVSKPQKMTKVLQDEDYDAEGDDDDYDEEEGVTELPEFGKCEDGFRKNTNGECIGSYIFCTHFIPLRN